jgi:hypothetical protein
MLGHAGALLFNGDLPVTSRATDHTAALPHAHSFPVLGVLRRLRHDPAPSTGVASAPRPAGCRPAGATPGRFPRSLMSALTGLGVQLYPGGIAAGRTSQSWPGPPATQITRATEADGSKATTRPAPQRGPSTRFTGPLTTHGASATGSVALRLPSSLAGTRRLAVPTRPYIVEAAPGLAPDPGFDLPPASTGHCDDRRRAPPPARLLISASWRTRFLALVIDPWVG